MNGGGTEARPTVLEVHVPIEIEHGKGGYFARVTPSRFTLVRWRSERPKPADELARELVGLGHHLQDITDALYDADPNWTRNSEGRAAVGSAALRRRDADSEGAAVERPGARFPAPASKRSCASAPPHQVRETTC